MESIAGDLFATKGLEYLLVIGYLVLLVLCWRFVRPMRERSKVTGVGAGSLFRIRDDCYFHQGHTWARPMNGGVVRVGMDDLAQRLIGPASGLTLPQPGTRLTQGAIGWDVQVDGRRIPMLSPVDGEVVARNEAVLHDPEVVNREPYDDGWALEVRVPNPATVPRNLLSGDLAEAWRHQSAAAVRRLAGEDAVGIEGEIPPTGILRALEPTAWDRLAAAFLQTEDAAGSARVPREDDPWRGRAEEVQTV